MSLSTPKAFSPKYPGEKVTLAFNFARLTDRPTNPVWTVTWLRGTPDGSAAAMREGLPSVVGPRALQLISGGQAGADYLLECTVDDGIQRWTLQGILPVRAR